MDAKKGAGKVLKMFFYAGLILAGLYAVYYGLLQIKAFKDKNGQENPMLKSFVEKQFDSFNAAEAVLPGMEAEPTATEVVSRNLIRIDSSSSYDLHPAQMPGQGK